MKFTTVLTYVSAFCSAANALYVGSPTDYAVSEPEWEIEVAPNTTIIARGTIEKVREEALRHNPNWDEEYLHPAQAKAKAKAERALVNPSDLDKRVASDFDAVNIFCGGRWKSVEWIEAVHRIEYLYGVPGRPLNGPGWGECTRVSCAYDTAVVWCNDEPHTKVLTGFNEIADGAMTILGKCTQTKMGSERRVSGQAFHRMNWNVIVRKESC